MATCNICGSLLDRGMCPNHGRDERRAYEIKKANEEHIEGLNDRAQVNLSQLTEGAEYVLVRYISRTPNSEQRPYYGYAAYTPGGWAIPGGFGKDWSNAVENGQEVEGFTLIMRLDKDGVAIPTEVKCSIVLSFTDAPKAP